jgi:hypothetical protein
MNIDDCLRQAARSLDQSAVDVDVEAHLRELHAGEREWTEWGEQRKHHRQGWPLVPAVVFIGFAYALAGSLQLLRPILVLAGAIVVSVSMFLALSYNRASNPRTSYLRTSIAAATIAAIAILLGCLHQATMVQNQSRVEAARAAAEAARAAVAEATLARSRLFAVSIDNSGSQRLSLLLSVAAFSVNHVETNDRGFLSRQKDQVSAVALSPNGRFLASSGDGGTVVLWDVTNGSILQRLTIRNSTPSVSIQGIAFSPDGRVLASVNDRGLYLWDLEARDLISTHYPTDGPASSISFSPNGKMIAVGETRGQIALWSMNSRTQRLTRNALLTTGHKARPVSVAFGANGATLAAAYSDNEVLFWDVNEQRLVGKLSGSDGNQAIDLAFSPDGELLALGKTDNTIDLWDPESGTLLKRSA